MEEALDLSFDRLLMMMMMIIADVYERMTGQLQEIKQRERGRRSSSQSKRNISNTEKKKGSSDPI